MRTWAHGDGEAVCAEPGGEAIGVAVEPQRCDLYAAGPMRRRGAAWKLGRPIFVTDQLVSSFSLTFGSFLFWLLASLEGP